MNFIKKIRKNKKLQSFLFKIIPVLIISIPFLSSAQGGDPRIPSSTSLQSILWWFQARLWSSWVVLLLVFPILFFIQGVAVLIMNAGNEEKRSEGKKRMIWGLVTLFIIFSVWAIIKIFQIIFFGTYENLPGNIFSPDFQ